MILVVGATGQLGTALVRRLSAAHYPVRAFVRPTSRYRHLQAYGPELAFGDLRIPESVDVACRGVDTVMATANVVAPRGRTSFESTEGTGYRTLIDTCERVGVSRFLFVSIPVTPYDSGIPTARYKRLIEERLRQSGLACTIFRASFFMDVWLALLGSSIPLRKSEVPTLQRPFWFSRAFMSAVGHLIEGRGLALVPGTGQTRHAFIALEDVAEFMVKSLGRPRGANPIVEIGGPEMLSWDEVVAIFGRVLERPIRAAHTPAVLFRIAMKLLMPLSPAAANVMGLSYLAAQVNTLYDSRPLARELGVSLTTVEGFLRARLG